MGYNQHFQGSDYILSRKPGNSPEIYKITNLNILITVLALDNNSSNVLNLQYPKKDRHEGVIETGNLRSTFL